MDVLSGKWKIAIITSLSFGEKRYSEILKEVEGISGKMLTRELKDMEMNLLIKRTVLNTQPVIVQYAFQNTAKARCRLSAILEIGELHIESYNREITGVL